MSGESAARRATCLRCEQLRANVVCANLPNLPLGWQQAEAQCPLGRWRACELTGEGEVRLPGITGGATSPADVQREMLKQSGAVA